MVNFILHEQKNITIFKKIYKKYLLKDFDAKKKKEKKSLSWKADTRDIVLKLRDRCQISLLILIH